MIQLRQWLLRGILYPLFFSGMALLPLDAADLVKKTHDDVRQKIVDYIDDENSDDSNQNNQLDEVKVSLEEYFQDIKVDNFKDEIQFFNKVVMPENWPESLQKMSIENQENDNFMGEESAITKKTVKKINILDIFSKVLLKNGFSIEDKNNPSKLAEKLLEAWEARVKEVYRDLIKEKESEKKDADQEEASLDFDKADKYWDEVVVNVFSPTSYNYDKKRDELEQWPKEEKETQQRLANEEKKNEKHFREKMEAVIDLIVDKLSLEILSSGVSNKENKGSTLLDEWTKELVGGDWLESDTSGGTGLHHSDIIFYDGNEEDKLPSRRYLADQVTKRISQEGAIGKQLQKTYMSYDELIPTVKVLLGINQLVNQLQDNNFIRLHQTEAAKISEQRKKWTKSLKNHIESMVDVEFQLDGFLDEEKMKIDDSECLKDATNKHLLTIKTISELVKDQKEYHFLPQKLAELFNKYIVSVLSSLRLSKNSGYKDELNEYTKKINWKSFIEKKPKKEESKKDQNKKEENTKEKQPKKDKDKKKDKSQEEESKKDQNKKEENTKEKQPKKDKDKKKDKSQEEESKKDQNKKEENTKEEQPKKNKPRGYRVKIVIIVAIIVGLAGLATYKIYQLMQKKEATTE